jgi:3-methyladenine DNA glycosylase AlkD
MLMTVQQIQQHFRKFANKDKATILRGFFKTRPGEYGEGDEFLGIAVPVIRRTAREFRDAPFSETKKLIQSSYHEERLLSLLMLVQLYSKGDDSLKKKIFDFYLKSTGYINNWDLVDLSAPNIVGNYLADKSRKPLYDLAKSCDLWRRRIAIMATFCFIRQNDFSDSLKLSKLLLADNHDLIHKAVGWMLREIGKRSLSVEEKFLKLHYKKMPRTMLRYTVERFPEDKRQRYLNGTV